MDAAVAMSWATNSIGILSFAAVLLFVGYLFWFWYTESEAQKARVKENIEQKVAEAKLEKGDTIILTEPPMDPETAKQFAAHLRHLMDKEVK